MIRGGGQGPQAPGPRSGRGRFDGPFWQGGEGEGGVTWDSTQGKNKRGTLRWEWDCPDREEGLRWTKGAVVAGPVLAPAT